MTTPEGSAPAPPPAHPRAMNILSRKPLTTARAAWIIASVTVSMTIISGVLIHFTDKKNYPDIGDGLWWAIQTVTTVGYGDLVPTSTTGRFVATLVMVVGIGFLTVITAAITSAFVESARRRFEGTRTDTLSAKLDEIDMRLHVIEAGIKKIGGHQRDAPR
jgi:voltage-gated potassium channel